MKKIFTLCFALFCAMTSFAQDEAKGMFDFCDKDGKVIASGTTITINELEESELGYYQLNTGLYAKQNVMKYDGLDVAVALGVEVERLDNGGIQYCFPGSCAVANVAGEYESEPDFFTGIKSIATEWIPDPDPEDDSETPLPLSGEATAKFTLLAYTKEGGKVCIGESSTVTVHFINDATTGVNGITDNAAVTEVARFAADGSRLSAPQKGLNIVKLSNGKTIKYINK